jgi:hypothetical protein
VRGYDQLFGYQFALRFNTELARFNDLILSPDSKLDKEWFGLNNIEKGLISALWYEAQPAEVQDGEVLFTLSFTARQPFSLSELFALDHQAMSAEAYGANEEIRPVELSLDNALDVVPGFEVFQNVPNPFTEGTILPVQLPHEGVVDLEIYSLDGRLVHRQSEFVERGYHEFHVTKEQLQQGGIYYYTISTDRFSGTRKMTMLK